MIVRGFLLLFLVVRCSGRLMCSLFCCLCFFHMSRKDNEVLANIIFRDLKGRGGVRRSRPSGADKICLFLKFCQRIYIKWYFEAWEPPKMQKIIKIRQKVCKNVNLQTFSQNLRKKSAETGFRRNSIRV